MDAVGAKLVGTARIAADQETRASVFRNDLDTDQDMIGAQVRKTGPNDKSARVDGRGLARLVIPVDLNGRLVGASRFQIELGRARWLDDESRVVGFQRGEGHLLRSVRVRRAQEKLDFGLVVGVIL